MNIIHCGMKYANSRNGQKEIELVRAELAPPFATALRWAAAFPAPPTPSLSFFCRPHCRVSF